MDWRQILMPPETTVLNALQVIDSGAVQIALVVDENQKLLGTVTDGDIRRGILAGYPLDVSVKKVMNSSPVVAKADQSSEAIAEQMQALELLQLPVVNETSPFTPSDLAVFVKILIVSLLVILKLFKRIVEPAILSWMV